MIDFSFFDYQILKDVFLWIGRLWFLWLPLFLGFILWYTWFYQIRAAYIKSIAWVLLDIKVPRDIAKTPQAMETVLTSLYTTYAGNWWRRISTGFLPSWYSLEIASINGEVHFFIYTQQFFRNFLESQIYSQYPGVEIEEVDDYTYASNFNLNEWNLWGGEFTLSKEDAYPIRTYVDFGLRDTALKEEQKVNPVVSFLEFMGSLKQGEQVWIQVLIRGAKKNWIEPGKKLVEELMGREKMEAGGQMNWGILAKSKGEQEVIAAIERNISKPGFETGIRTIYLAKRDIFDIANMAAIKGLMTQYNTYNLNGFSNTYTTLIGGLFSDYRGRRKKNVVFDAFRKRSWFYPPHRRKPFVFNSEELATVYHYPGRVAETPTFGRVESKKAAPPPNLPI